MTKIEYWEDDETPDNTGWYICEYDDANAMLKKSPYDCVGPYDTKTQALRVLRETSNPQELHYVEDDKPV